MTETVEHVETAEQSVKSARSKVGTSFNAWEVKKFDPHPYEGVLLYYCDGTVQLGRALHDAIAASGYVLARAAMLENGDE